MERKVEKYILAVEEPTSQIAQIPQPNSKTAEFANFIMEQTLNVMFIAGSYLSAYMIVHFNLRSTSFTTLMASALFMAFIGFTIYKGKSKVKRAKKTKAYSEHNMDVIDTGIVRRITLTALKVVCWNVLLFGITYGLGLLITGIKGFLSG